MPWMSQKGVAMVGGFNVRIGRHKALHFKNFLSKFFFFLKLFYKNPCIVVSCFHQNYNECTHNKMDNNKLLLECMLKDQSVWRLVQHRQSFGIEMIKHILQM